MQEKSMKIQNVYVRTEDVAAMQYFMEITNEKGARPAYFDIILKSGVTMHVQGDEDIYAKAVEQMGID